MKRVCVDFEDELAKALAVWCVLNGRSVAEVIRELVDDFLVARPNVLPGRPDKRKRKGELKKEIK